MKTKTMLVALATMLIGSLYFWACQKEIPLQAPTEAETLIIPGEYIVVFKDGVTDVPGLARQLVAQYEGEVSYIYEHAIRGFAAKLPPEALETLSSHPQIAWIEADQQAWTAGLEMTGTQSGVSEKTGSQTGDVPWGLDRIDQVKLPLDNIYNYNQTGKHVHVYIIGTGIRFTHNEFWDEEKQQYRAVPGFDYRGDGWDTSDIGRGTSLASVVGGNTYGAAKKVTLVSVRVIGPGPSAKNIIAGVDYVTAQHNKPAVAFMDIISAQSNALEAAIRNSVAAGVTYVVPEMDNYPSCNYTPSRMPEVITVSATRRDDERRKQSSDLSCVDLFAPGTGIPSACNKNDDDTDIYYGSSWAAAHVAGVAALYLEINPNALPEQVFAAVIETATPNVVTYNGVALNKPLLYSLAWNGGEVPPPPTNEPPVANFRYTTAGLTVTFTDLSYDNDGSVVAWVWNFGDGATSSARNPTHTYATDGTFNVTLTVTDNKGATGSQSQSVTVTAPPPSGNNPPTITTFEVSRSTAGPWHRAHMNWAVNDQDGDLANVRLELLSGDTLLESINISVNGSSASGNNELRSRTNPTAVKIIVTDSKGNSVEQIKSV